MPVWRLLKHHDALHSIFDVTDKTPCFKVHKVVPPNAGARQSDPLNARARRREPTEMTEC